MKAFISVLCAAAIFVGMVTAASAATLPVTDKQFQTVGGQNFTFDFSSLPTSSIGDGTLTIHARGDYGNQASEFLTWNLESGALIGQLGPCNHDASTCTITDGAFTSPPVAHDANDRDFEFTAVITIPAAVLLSLISDGDLSLLVDLNSAVDTILTGAQAPYVEVSLNFATVPLPAGLSLMASALAALGGLALWSRKRTSRFA